MRELLEAVADGSLSPTEAEAELRGYATGEAGRFDAAREQRRGVPEAIFADGKSAPQVAALAETALETTGRALLTRVSDRQFAALEKFVDEAVPEATIDRRHTTVRVMMPDYEPPSLEATVGIATGGTVDEAVADEAAAVCQDAGATVDRVDDVVIFPVTTLAMYENDQLRAVFPCSDEEHVYHVSDCLDAMEDGREDWLDQFDSITVDRRGPWLESDVSAD